MGMGRGVGPNPPCVWLGEEKRVPAPPDEDPSRFQVPAHPSFFRLLMVGKLLERASAKASPHLLLLKLPQEEARQQVMSAGRGWRS